MHYISQQDLAKNVLYLYCKSKLIYSHRFPTLFPESWRYSLILRSSLRIKCHIEVGSVLLRLSGPRPREKTIPRWFGCFFALRLCFNGAVVLMPRLAGLLITRRIFWQDISRVRSFGLGVLAGIGWWGAAQSCSPKLGWKVSLALGEKTSQNTNQKTHF